MTSSQPITAKFKVSGPDTPELMIWKLTAKPPPPRKISWMMTEVDRTPFKYPVVFAWRVHKFTPDQCLLICCASFTSWFYLGVFVCLLAKMRFTLVIGLVFCCSLSLADPLSGMFSSSFKIVKSFYDEVMNESERFTFAISILALIVLSPAVGKRFLSPSHQKS